MKYMLNSDAAFVRLEKEDDDSSIVLYVGDWMVVRLREDGRLETIPGIDNPNDEGLQVDSEGRIKVVKA